MKIYIFILSTFFLFYKSQSNFCNCDLVKEIISSKDFLIKLHLTNEKIIYLNGNDLCDINEKVNESLEIKTFKENEFPKGAKILKLIKLKNLENKIVFYYKSENTEISITKTNEGYKFTTIEK